MPRTTNGVPAFETAAHRTGILGFFQIACGSPALANRFDVERIAREAATPWVT